MFAPGEKSPARLTSFGRAAADAWYWRQVPAFALRLRFASALGGSDPLAAMRAGAAMFLEACLEPEVQRIVLLDAPAVPAKASGAA